jgi:hypothetical protein
VSERNLSTMTVGLILVILAGLVLLEYLAQVQTEKLAARVAKLENTLLTITPRTAPRAKPKGVTKNGDDRAA